MSFDFRLFSLLVLICIPGLLVAIPRQLGSLQSTAGNPAMVRRMPNRRQLVAIGLAQYLLFVAITAGLGTLLTPDLSLGAPFFTAIAQGAALPSGFGTRILQAAAIGLAASIPFVASYYLLVRPRLDPHTVRQVERLRISLGVPARFLYGGIVEEVINRWAAMSFLAWLVALVVGSESVVTSWTAIVLSALVFGLGHLPSLRAAGVQRTRFLVASTIGLNLYGGSVFGWLFWQFGLLAAMLAHMIFHAVWLPFELRAVQATPPKVAT